MHRAAVCEDSQARTASTNQRTTHRTVQTWRGHILTAVSFTAPFVDQNNGKKPNAVGGVLRRSSFGKRTSFASIHANEGEISVYYTANCLSYATIKLFSIKFWCFIEYFRHWWYWARPNSSDYDDMNPSASQLYQLRDVSPPSVHW